MRMEEIESGNNILVARDLEADLHFRQLLLQGSRWKETLQEIR